LLMCVSFPLIPAFSLREKESIRPFTVMGKSPDSSSDRADFYAADFFTDFFEEVFLVAELLQVGVSHQPAEIVVTLLDSFDQGVCGAIQPADQGVTAGEVVKNGRILRF